MSQVLVSLNNTSLTEEDVKQGKCGGQIIPRDAKGSGKIYPRV